MLVVNRTREEAKRTRSVASLRRFVLTLCYSRKSVRLLIWRSCSRVRAEPHERAFRRLGGCPRLVVLDQYEFVYPDIDATRLRE